MKNMKKTVKDYNWALQIANAIKEENYPIAYAAKKFFEKNKKFQEDLQEKVSAVALEHCSVDDKGNIDWEVVGQNKDFKFTKENKKKYDAEIKKIYAEEIEVTKDMIYLCPPDRLYINVKIEGGQIIKFDNPTPDLKPLNGLCFIYDFDAATEVEPFESWNPDEAQAEVSTIVDNK